MEQISRIGMDTSKHIFQLHGVNAAEQPILRRKLRREDMVAFFAGLEPVEIAIEACGASHHWARLTAPPDPSLAITGPRSDRADANSVIRAVDVAHQSGPPAMRVTPFFLARKIETVSTSLLLGDRE